MSTIYSVTFLIFGILNNLLHILKKTVEIFSRSGSVSGKKVNISDLWVKGGKICFQVVGVRVDRYCIFCTSLSAPPQSKNTNHFAIFPDTFKLVIHGCAFCVHNGNYIDHTLGEHFAEHLCPVHRSDPELFVACHFYSPLQCSLL